MLKKNNVEMIKTRTVLSYAMSKLDEETVMNLVKWELEQGTDPFILLEEARAGMDKVSELYNSGHYFLGDLIVAAEIFQDVLSLLIEIKDIKPVSNFPPIVFGTVEGDIHDIGKNITIGVLEGQGHQIQDLGVDVAPRVFVEAVKQTNSLIVCLSGLTTTAYESMKKTVKLLEEEGLRSQVYVIIGGLVNDAVKNYIGADYSFNDCTKASLKIKEILNNCKTRRLVSF